MRNRERDLLNVQTTPEEIKAKKPHGDDICNIATITCSSLRYRRASSIRSDVDFIYAELYALMSNGIHIGREVRFPHAGDTFPDDLRIAQIITGMPVDFRAFVLPPYSSFARERASRIILWYGMSGKEISRDFITRRHKSLF